MSYSIRGSRPRRLPLEHSALVVPERVGDRSNPPNRLAAGWTPGANETLELRREEQHGTYGKQSAR